MSPTRKKAAKKKAAKTTRKAAAKKKPARKKAAKTAAKKKAAKKSASATRKAAKKPSKKSSAAAGKKAAKKSPAKATRKTAAKPAAKTAAKKAAAKKQSKTQAAATKSGKAKSAQKDADEAAPPRRARPRNPITPPGPRHPKLGYKWACFSCGAKFYDLGKEDPVCPKCGADQRDRPPDEPKRAAEPSKPKVVRPMAQLLDEEEPRPAASEGIELNELDLAGGSGGGGGEAMFDDTEIADVEIEIDEGAEQVVDGTPELDEL